MMKRATLISLIFLFVSLGARAQDRVAWDLTLDTLVVTERLMTQAKEVNIGAKVTEIEPEILQVFQSRSLAELLSDNTSISIKSRGLGALATASFRGAGASQTRVNWNGVNITPVMAGVFDFSQMPVFFADKVSIVYGSNDVKSGTGAVGGSINISNSPVWDGRTVVDLAGEYGSYSTYTARGAVRYGTSKLSMKTRAYYQHSDNNYSYLNKVSGNDAFMEQRVDAQYSMASAMQDIHYKVGPQSIITGSAWYQYGDRMLPQPLGVESTSHEKQREDNFRAYLGLNSYADRWELALKSAYIYYRMKYGKWYDATFMDPLGNTNASHTTHLSADFSYHFTERLHYNTTLTYQHDMALAESYRDLDPDHYTIDDMEFKRPDAEPAVRRYRDILSYHNALRWEITSRWLTDVRLMVETVDWKRPVMTYSLGFVGNLIPQRLNLRGSVAYNYRNPSLNELYWRPGGNPNVEPERGTSFDMTLNYTQPLGRHLRLTAQVAPYLMLIDSWILWLPKDESSEGNRGYSSNQWLWTPQNKRDVLSVGGELMAKLAFRYNDLLSSVVFNYSYTDSHTRTKQHKDDGSLMKQIPYIPRQKWSLRWEMAYKGVLANFQTNYVGVRYITTDQSYFTYPYNVCHLQLGYGFRVGQIFISPQVRIDNLFNTYYESTQYYPMPRRNILGSLMIKF